MLSLRQFGILKVIFPFFLGGEYFHAKYFWNSVGRKTVVIYWKYVWCVKCVPCSFNFIEYSQFARKITEKSESSLITLDVRAQKEKKVKRCRFGIIQCKNLPWTWTKNTPSECTLTLVLASDNRNHNVVWHRFLHLTYTRIHVAASSSLHPTFVVFEFNIYWRVGSLFFGYHKSSSSPSPSLSTISLTQ